MKKLVDAIQLAEYVIAFFDRKGEPITNKKLNKLLYYIEAWHLVFFNRSLFSNRIEAWVYGPVVPEVYRKFKEFRYKQIILGYEGTDSSKKLRQLKVDLNFTNGQIELIEKVCEKYGSLSAFALERLSHSEKPWLVARGDCGITQNCDNEISRDLMKKYYAGVIKGGQA